MKKIALHFCFVALIAISLSINVQAQTNAASASPKADALFANPVVAKGKGFEIKQSQVEDAFIEYKSNQAARGQTIAESDRQIVESNLLQGLIVTKILVSRANDADKDAAKAATEKGLEQARKQFPTEAAFLQKLKTTGITLEQFQARTLEQMICQAVLSREVSSKVIITEQDARKFYDENPARFERPETVRTAHIYFLSVDKTTQQPLPPAKKKEREQFAKTIKVRIDKGEDFSKLAREFSEDPGTKDKGGELPPFARGEMGVPEFETAAFSLKTNQVSDVVESRLGYHLIKLLQKIPPKKVEFEMVVPDLKEGLTRQEAQKLLPAYFDKVKKEANVEIIGGERKAVSGAVPPEKVPAK